MSTANLPEIYVKEAARLGQGVRVLMLDVREHDDRAAGRARDAKHMVLSQLRPAEVPTDRPVTAMPRSGNRSGKAAH